MLQLQLQVLLCVQYAAARACTALFGAVRGWLQCIAALTGSQGSACSSSLRIREGRAI